MLPAQISTPATIKNRMVLGWNDWPRNSSRFLHRSHAASDVLVIGMKEWFDYFAAGALTGIFLGAVAMGWTISSDFKHQGIQHHFAHYDAVTGDWKWNGDK